MTGYQGLSTEEVIELQRKYGRNELDIRKKGSLPEVVLRSVCEPIFLLLFASSIVYFFLGEAGEGIVMLVFVAGIICLDVLQGWKTDKTLEALKKLSQPLVKVIRNGEQVFVGGVDLVPGDIVLVEEGCKIPADGVVLSSHDFCLDESLLTGEAGEVWKLPAVQNKDASGPVLPMGRTSELALAALDNTRKDYCYAGTLVTQGNAVLKIDRIGLDTVYGKIGLGVAAAPRRLTPLQQQMRKLTICCTWIALLLFLLVSIVTCFNLSDCGWTERIIQSLLAGIVLSLSMIPAEFPVILTVFLSMGALRLTKQQALIRVLPAVETLGAVSVICADKTGTLTRNDMSVAAVRLYECEEACLAMAAGMACDESPHDVMEKAILNYCNGIGIYPDSIFDGIFLKGYPFLQECKTMAHVWNKGGRILIAAKGSPEWLLEHCLLSPPERRRVQTEADHLSQSGLRVIAVGVTDTISERQIPDRLQECRFKLCGLLGFMDPPKESVKKDIRICRDAGIRVVMITGDSGHTAAAVARKIHLPGSDAILTGNEIAKLSDSELLAAVRHINIFSRVVPEQKMRIIEALRANGVVTAMTGDGVNDAPALKHADIGIAMGLRGSEITREAADLILLDDNFSTIVNAIKDGRRIYVNIQKAIGYVFAIHIPIAFTCLIGPLLHIAPDKLMLLPLHVVLLELIMNPACSTVIERQPADAGIMKQGPRMPDSRLLTAKILIKSAVQGIAIFAGSFGSYYFFLIHEAGKVPLARTSGLSTLILSNIFLILVNNSDMEYAYQSFLKLKKDRGIAIVGIAAVLLLLLILYSPLSGPLMLVPLSGTRLLAVSAVSFLSVFWYDMVKFFHAKCR